MMIPVLKKYQLTWTLWRSARGGISSRPTKGRQQRHHRAYESFVKELDSGMPEDFARAETLHKKPHLRSARR